MVKRTRFIYLSSLDFDNVFKTQIIGWLKLYNEKGTTFEIIKTDSIAYIFNQSKKRQIGKIKSHYKGKNHHIFIFPSRFFIGRFLNIIIFLILFARDFLQRNPVLIITRSSGFWREFRFLKRIIQNKLIIIFDSRAAYTEEMKYQIEKNKLIEKKYSAKTKRIDQDERMMVTVSDKVFCVSNALIQYHQNRSSTCLPSKFVINPCCANSKEFYPDFNKRHTIRKELGIENKKVIVYSGGLELAWHVPDEIFFIFKEIQQSIPDVFLLILTNDIKIAERFIKKYQINSNDYLLLSVDNSLISNYLNASDAGLLLREKNIMNSVGSPTKFAEYVMSGLPVIISDGVGDFSEYVRNTKFGIVVKENTKIPIQEIDALLKQSSENFAFRQEIASKSSIFFSKEALLNRNVEIFFSLINQSDEKQNR